MPKGGAAAAHDDDTFETSESGAADIVPKQCSALRKNETVMIKGKPCKIVEMTTSKTGKHGHAKVHLTGIDIFDGKKYEDICPSTHNMSVPVVKTVNYTLLDISEDGFATLLDDKGEQKEDLKIPDGELGKQIRAGFEEGQDLMLNVTCACGREQIMGQKPQNVNK